MTTRARLEDPDVSISDILLPAEESAWRLGGVEYRILVKACGAVWNAASRWRIGLARKTDKGYVTVRVVGSVHTGAAYTRVIRLLPRLLASDVGKWPPRENRRYKRPIGREELVERARAAKRAKAEQALARWQRKLKTAETKIKKYRRQLKRMERTA